MATMLEPVGPGSEDEPPLVQRLAWFGGIALVSMLVVAAVAYSLRGLLLIG